MSTATLDLPIPPDEAARRASPGAHRVACAHCGLPVPAGCIDDSAGEQFCCEGCRTVYRVIHGCGLERFYRLRDRSGWTAAASRATGQRYAEYDDAAFLSAYARPGPDGTWSIELLLEGVHCGACVWLVEKLPRLVHGVVEARLNLRRSRVHIVWDPSLVHLSAIARALDSLGYPPHPARATAAEALRRADDRRLLVRLAIAGAAAGNAMLLAIALYAGAAAGMEPAYEALLRGASAVVGLIAVAWPGSLFFRGAWAALRTRTPNIDVPIALGLGVGAVSGLINTVRFSGEIYFDSLTMLVFLLLVARWIQGRQQRQAADAVELLFTLTPTRARRLRDGDVEEVAIGSLRPGDVVEIRAQESVPVDGQVLEGESLVDQTLLTGESHPVAAAAGDRVHAGAVSLTGRLCVRVEAAGEATRVGQLMRLVEDALRHKAPIVHLMNRVAGRFIVAVVLLACATLAMWLWLDPNRAAEHTIALLIVACPCALGLATPLALAVGVGRAAQRGILIKGGAALEQLARTGTILLDKTGTVTCGRMSLVRWHGPEEVKSLVAAVEARASHPIARALCAALTTDAAPIAEQVVQSPGGIAGVVAGRSVMVGSQAFLRAAAVPEPGWVHDFLATAAGESLTPVLVAVEGEVAAAAALGDELQPEAARCIASLRASGWRVGLLSGDHPALVGRVARRLGVDAAEHQGGLSPEEKRAIVESRARDQTVVMVGDGVNDAASLAAAHVGIAVCGGAEASLAAADVYLSRPGLGSLLELMGAARRTLRVIHRCLAASLVYNCAGVGLAMAGLITPLLAALLMPISSLTVVGLAVGVRTFGARRCP